MTVIYKKKKKYKIFPDLNDRNYESYPLGVSVICCTRRPNYIENVLNNFLRQNYKKKEMIVILHGSSMNLEYYKNKSSQYKNIKVFRFDESVPLGECKNFGVKNSIFRYIAVFDDDDFYASNYLKHSIEVFDNVNCDIVGKTSYFTYFEKIRTLALSRPKNENRFQYHVADSSLVIHRRVFNKVKFPSIAYPDAHFQQLCVDFRLKIYSTNRFNYVVHRHHDPKYKHDWDISDQDLLIGSEIIATDIDDYIGFINC